VGDLIRCFGDIGGCRSTDSQWIATKMPHHPLAHPWEQILWHTKSSVVTFFGAGKGPNFAVLELSEDTSLRIHNESPLAHNAIHSCTRRKLFRHIKSAVRGCCWAWGRQKSGVVARRPCSVAKQNTATTVLWIRQQPMLQSRIGRMEAIL